MRIVAGRFRGRPLAAPEGLAVRPTSDRAREALFNILVQGKIAERGPALTGARVLDAFAGTGALGLEALSRGAAHVVFMEEHVAAEAVLHDNLRRLDVQDESTVLRADVLRPPPAARHGGACGLVLMDPPYNLGLAEPALTALDTAGWLAPGALVTVELLKSESLATPPGFEPLDERTYGKAKVVFLRRVA